MKKAIIVYFLWTILFLTGCNATETVQDGDFEYGHSKFPGEYFPVTYSWDGSEENMNIYIPDEYEGKKITKVGGYLGRGVPMPFSICMPQEYDIPNEDDLAFCTEEEELVKDKEYDTYTFTIHLGSDIKEYYGTEDTYVGREDDNKQDIIYKIEYRYDVDKGNPYLEVVDGKLCQKK